MPTNTSQGDCFVDEEHYSDICVRHCLFDISLKTLLFPFSLSICHAYQYKSWKQYETSEIHYVRMPYVILETSGTFNIF